MKEVVLKINKLTKKYGKQLANDSIDMTINKGDIYGFIGKNGAGKTTFMRMITGLIYKTSGDIELLGRTGSDLDKARTMVGSLIETPAFYKDMSARDNLEISRRIRGITNKGAVDEVLELVGLKDVGKKKVKNFSLGMRQRLGIANAILGNPRFLILDEPINGLDPIGIVEIRELIKKINKEKEVTVLISSHILEELKELTTKYGIISNGRLIEEITAEELKEKCRENIFLKVSDAAKAVTVLEKEYKDINYEVIEDNEIRVFNHLDSLGEINKLLNCSEVIVEGIELKGEKLEDYFIARIGGAFKNA